MLRCVLFLLISLLASSFSQAARKKPCLCTCVIKKDDGKYGTLSGKGVDRQAAGEDLKKNLGRKKCELSPDCEGDCRPDED